MKLKALLISGKPITSETLSRIESKDRAGVFRILDQTTFEGTQNDGGCQFASLFSAIEEKYQREIPVEKMQECYERADRFWNGKTEKISRAIRYMMVVGFDFGFGRVKAVNYHSFSPKHISFDDVFDAVLKFDYVGLGLGANSAFFSDVTGRLYSQFTLPGGHAMRAKIRPVDQRSEPTLRAVNSWDYDWGDSGCGIIPKSKFGLLRFWEIKCCDFVIVE